MIEWQRIRRSGNWPLSKRYLLFTYPKSQPEAWYVIGSNKPFERQLEISWTPGVVWDNNADEIIKHNLDFRTLVVFTSACLEHLRNVSINYHKRYTQREVDRQSLRDLRKIRKS